MKKLFYLNMILLLLFASCGNVKQIQTYVNTGNYDAAIDLSIEKLQKKRGSKGGDPYAVLLKEAYDKATQRDLSKINKLKRDVNPEKWQGIFDTYLQLDTRQEKIKPLMPLHLVKQNRNLDFTFTDYTNDLLDAKHHLAAHLYKKAKILMATGQKVDFRAAYDLLDNLDRMDPNYKDVRNLMTQTHQRGMTYALVEIKNETNKIIPKQLQVDILNFSSYGANNFWVEYHNYGVANLQYDYKINLKFKQIDISPDQAREKEIIETKDIQDGFTYQKDAGGNIVKDSLGHAIKIPRMISIRSNVHLYQQYKEAQVQAETEIVDLRTNQRKANIPLQSKFIFDHNYATYTGDRRAIRNDYINFLKEKQVVFPSNEKMVFDASQEIKMNFKDILNQAEFL